MKSKLYGDCSWASLLRKVFDSLYKRGSLFFARKDLNLLIGNLFWDMHDAVAVA